MCFKGSVWSLTKRKSYYIHMQKNIMYRKIPYLFFEEGVQRSQVSPFSLSSSGSCRLNIVSCNRIWRASIIEVRVAPHPHRPWCAHACLPNHQDEVRLTSNLFASIYCLNIMSTEYMQYTWITWTSHVAQHLSMISWTTLYSHMLLSVMHVQLFGSISTNRKDLGSGNIALRTRKCASTVNPL